MMYRIRLEKRYRERVSGTHLSILKEYMPHLMPLNDGMGHAIRIIQFEKGNFATGIYDIENLDLTEEEDRIYFGRIARKPEFNHVEMDIKIFTSFEIECLREPREWRVVRERGEYNVHIQNSRMWVQFMRKTAIPYQPSIMMIGADPKDYVQDLK